jgi:FkbM family methyltransferase
MTGKKSVRELLSRRAARSGGRPAWWRGILRRLVRPPAGLVRADDLIIDVGAHLGHDTDFYLRKGFRVVAVEANPILVERLDRTFQDFIRSGRLVVLPFGIHEGEGEFTFYRNLDKDDWSSFIFEVGARDNTRYQALRVHCIRFEEVLKTFGIPYYLKIDIEGHDSHVLKALLRLRATPRFVSVEGHDLSYLAYLRALGYDRFKTINQSRNWKTPCPHPPREGTYVEYQFDGHSSGLFGEETPGEWKGFEETAYEYLHMKLGYPDRHNLGEGWFDFHAKMA